MSAFDNAAWIGTRAVRPTDAQLAQIAQRDTGLYQVNMDYFWRHAGYFQQQLSIAATISSTTVEGISTIARVPFKVVAVDLGVETSAGSAATGMVEKALAATPTTWTDLLEADVDVHTGLKVMQAGSVTSGKEDFAAGDRFRASFTATGGAIVGNRIVMHCFRL